ncbi:MAG: LysM peptidoglycan-binding domain-containing protein [Caldilineaceae bacterium]|nr:LysM peptidoglycan-binding domain-containing protein [Caldilineaceae bacterium]
MTGPFRRNGRHGAGQRVRLVWWLVLLLLLGWLWGPTSALRAQEEETYVVQAGDTLSEIAKAHGTDTETLRRLNGLGDIDYVWVGQRLLLPASLPSEPTNAPTAESSNVQTTATPSPTISSTATLVPSTATPTATPTASVTPETASETMDNFVPVVSQTERTGIHIVQKGDTLSKIAIHYQTTLAHLIEFNQISPAQRLHEGQALVVPIAGEAVAVAEGLEPEIHTVQAGEYLSTIAKQYDVPMGVLASVNGIGNSDMIVPGQKLTIPAESDLIASDSFQMGSDGYHVHTTFPTLTEKWIDVDLSEQRLVAYRGRKPIKSFLISSGRPGTPTVTGVFRIWAKTPLQDMYAGNRAAGYSYYLEDVPWVQYFYKDYGLHAAYWHNNFGHPMSHGCVNISVENAEWLFKWASPTVTASSGWFISDEENPGTLVVVHD